MIGDRDDYPDGQRPDDRAWALILDERGRHDPGCPEAHGVGGDCDCGYADHAERHAVERPAGCRWCDAEAERAASRGVDR